MWSVEHQQQPWSKKLRMIPGRLKFCPHLKGLFGSSWYLVQTMMFGLKTCQSSVTTMHQVPPIDATVGAVADSR